MQTFGLFQPVITTMGHNVLIRYLLFHTILENPAQDKEYLRHFLPVTNERFDIVLLMQIVSQSLLNRCEVVCEKDQISISLQ